MVKLVWLGTIFIFKFEIKSKNLHCVVVGVRMTTIMMMLMAAVILMGDLICIRVSAHQSIAVTLCGASPIQNALS